jgi:hypothetical protein
MESSSNSERVMPRCIDFKDCILISPLIVNGNGGTEINSTATDLSKKNSNSTIPRVLASFV